VRLRVGWMDLFARYYGLASRVPPGLYQHRRVSPRIPTRASTERRIPDRHRYRVYRCFYVCLSGIPGFTRNTGFGRESEVHNVVARVVTRLYEYHATGGARRGSDFAR